MDQQTKPKPNGSLIQPPPAAEAFYSEVLQLMAKSEIPFLVSGTYALASYTGIDRPTKDVDVFAKAGDALKMLHYFTAFMKGAPRARFRSTMSPNSSAARRSAAPMRFWKFRPRASSPALRRTASATHWSGARQQPGGRSSESHTPLGG
jgi:hypothetical protein